LPLPLKSDPLHHVSIAINSQNELKKNVGVSTIKISDTYQVNDWVKLKNELSMTPEGLQFHKKLNLLFFKDKFTVEIGNTCA
jgi:hypothetical protein